MKRLSDRALAKVINDFLPYYEKESDNEKENIEIILKELNGSAEYLQEIYQFFCGFEPSLGLQTILDELQARIEILKNKKNK